MQRVIRTLTRPNNTISYAPGDVVCEPFEIHLSVNRGTYITTTSIVTDTPDYTGALMLHLFDADIPTQTDNLPLTSGIDIEDYLGFISFKRFSHPSSSLSYSYGIMNSNPLQLSGKNGTADITCVLAAMEQILSPPMAQKFCISMNMEYF